MAVVRGQRLNGRVGVGATRMTALRSWTAEANALVDAACDESFHRRAWEWLHSRLDHEECKRVEA